MQTIVSLRRLLQNDTDLIKVFFTVLDEHLRKRDKKLSHLRFAKQTTYGWSFFRKKSFDWEVLEEIARETARKHKHCSFSKVAESISHLINISQKNLSSFKKAVSA